MISAFEGHPRDLGWKETVVFFNEDEEFYYEEPAEAVDLKKRFVCLKITEAKYLENNKQITGNHPANFKYWSELDEEAYLVNKTMWEEDILRNGIRFLPSGKTQFTELKRRIG